MINRACKVVYCYINKKCLKRYCLCFRADPTFCYPVFWVQHITFWVESAQISSLVPWHLFAQRLSELLTTHLSWSQKKKNSCKYSILIIWQTPVQLLKWSLFPVWNWSGVWHPTMTQVKLVSSSILRRRSRRELSGRSNQVSSMWAERCQPADKEKEWGRSRMWGEKLCLWSWGNLLSFNRALHAIFILVPPPKNNIHGCMAAFFGRKRKKTEDKELEKYKNKILGQEVWNPTNTKQAMSFSKLRSFTSELINFDIQLHCVLCLFIFIICVSQVVVLKSCMSTVWKLFPPLVLAICFWLFPLPIELHCSILFFPSLALAGRNQRHAWCAALWHHFLCLWGKCICREAWGPPAELPGLPVTAWRHTVVAYPSVKFNPDPLESGSLSCPPALSLPPCSTAVSSFNEGSWNTWFLWGSSVCAFVCFECVFCFCLLCVHLQR